MKTILAVLILGVVACIADPPNPMLVQKALEKLDTINPADVLANKDKAAAVYKCAVDQGPCDEFGNGVKVLFPIVATVGCPVCTPEQKEKLINIASSLKHDYPEQYTAVLNHFFNGNEPEILKNL